MRLIMNLLKEKMAKNSKSKDLEIWNRLPKDLQNAILANVFCHQCNLITIIDYSIESSGSDIVLELTS